MWKITCNTLLSKLQNGKMLRFNNIDDFVYFRKFLGRRIGLFIDEGIYNDDLILKFNITESICTKPGYYYGSIDLDWDYEVVDRVIDFDSVIMFDRNNMF